MNVRAKKWFFGLLLFFMGAFVVDAQENPEEIYLTVVQNTSYQFEILSARIPTLIVPHPDLWDNRISTELGAVDRYTYHYTAGAPDAFDVVVEYYEVGPFPGWNAPKYTTVRINIVESVIYPTHDYQTIDVDHPGIEIHVTANDSASHGPLSLTHLPLVQNGSASITSDSTLLFTPTPGFSGMAYLHYVVEDSVGRNARGNVSVCVLETPVIAVDTIRRATSSTNNLALLLPAEGFQMDLTAVPDLGDVAFIGGDVIEYRPYSESDGLDMFRLHTADTSLVRWVIVDVIHKEEDNGFVRDDVVYTSKNTPVTFDAVANDLKKNNILVSYSNELVHDGAGVFTYTPPANYSGVKQFYYTMYNGFEHQSATIYVHVNNFYPEGVVHFNLRTPKNTPLTIQYDAPINNYGFSVLSSPQNGQATAQTGAGSVSTSCQTIDGFNLIVYDPNLDFVGTDEFDLDYCIDGANCRVAKVVVEVVDMPDSCFCTGPDCVWSGDTDGSGKVSVADILPIGFYMGSVGNARSSATPTDWYGQFGADWSESLPTGRSIKHVDTNGDGVISTHDTVAVSSHYDRYHSVIPEESLVVKDYPFAIVPHQTELDSGDMAVFDIMLGDVITPVTDIHGLAYTVNISGALVDSASLHVDFQEDEWFGNNSPILGLYKQPLDGQIEAALTRTNGISVSGDGVVSSLNFIVEDDVEGFRITSDRIPFVISVTDAHYYDGSGQKYRLPDATTTVYLDISEDEPKIIGEELVVLYPNPTSDQLTIHVNGRNTMREVAIYDLSSRLIRQQSELSANQIRLDVSTLPTGVYVARVLTDTGIVNKKFQIVQQN